MTALQFLVAWQHLLRSTDFTCLLRQDLQAGCCDALAGAVIALHKVQATLLMSHTNTGAQSLYENSIHDGL